MKKIFIALKPYIFSIIGICLMVGCFLLPIAAVVYVNKLMVPIVGDVFAFILAGLAFFISFGIIALFKPTTSSSINDAAKDK